MSVVERFSEAGFARRSHASEFGGRILNSGQLSGVEKVSARWGRFETAKEQTINRPKDLLSDLSCYH